MVAPVWMEPAVALQELNYRLCTQEFSMLMEPLNLALPTRGALTEATEIWDNGDFTGIGNPFPSPVSKDQSVLVLQGEN